MGHKVKVLRMPDGSFALTIDGRQVEGLKSFNVFGEGGYFTITFDPESVEMVKVQPPAEVWGAPPPPDGMLVLDGADPLPVPPAQ